MYLAFEEVLEAISRLVDLHPFFGISFLVGKKAPLPIGRGINFPYDSAERAFLDKYHKPDRNSKHYYQPFKTSGAKRWLSPKYPSSGSQKTRTQGRLSRAFIHERGKDVWGWNVDYLAVLKAELQYGKTRRMIPCYWLAVWLCRGDEWPDTTEPKDIVDRFLREWRITVEEKTTLFDLTTPKVTRLSAEAYSDTKLLKEIGPAPDALPEEGGALKSLEIHGVGPARRLRFEPAERLTLVTGDNGLGKTFLLECAWWALTGHWPGEQAYPRADAPRSAASITFEISSGKEAPTKATSIKFDWDSQSWPKRKDRPTIPGLIVYARVDGSFAVWDPVGRPQPQQTQGSERYLVFSREDVLTGQPDKIEGLLRDWVSWQRSPDQSLFAAFKRVLSALSPPEAPLLDPGEPTRLPGRPQEIPTIRHTYGAIPFIHESAGIRRICTIAYLLVWVWNEHNVYSKLVRRAPQNRLAILIDEIEAHLHPKWQRSVLPALLDVTTILAESIRPQLIVATHSPLIMASIEQHFDVSLDCLFHLGLSAEQEVELKQVPFIKRGRVNSWLTSDIFELSDARSREGEDAIKRARRLLEEGEPSVNEIRSVTEDLRQALPADDEFWPRWAHFAQRRGVKI